ncbi:MULTISPECIES: TetR/AcrR family transcriptional regulator [Thermomonosporaceae]|uniref:TetR/AcrR family transcriptional regulator n=1 Tax=Thermomonosporaceae TaxID=2012 RepID=UPI00255AE8F1|nr:MULTISPECIES: TetR/AcrR family transcriptional regulator [Thermomonosporaceae]MDL4771423.1 TetR/AcrR family transcriptional regulator [Actinomadura xylanilytica]
MPRVSEEHLERRRRQILDAARSCFVRRGLHETSMQDIFAESGLSAGAVYRYFKSKNEIIEAVASTVISDLHTFLADLVNRDPIPTLDTVVGLVTDKMVSLSGPDGPLRLAPQAWALALYDPRLGHYVEENVRNLRGTWIAYARRLTEAGLLPAGTDADAAGKLLFGLLPGFLLQRLILGDVDPDDFRRGIQALARASMTSLAT